MNPVCPPQGFSMSPRPSKQRRRQRTVYSVEQREALETSFQNNHYPSYDERETLAARLNLQEEQVQVWFKNRRAKHNREHRGVRAGQPGPKAQASPQIPGVGASLPAPAAAGPGIPADPAFASVPGFAWNPAFASGPGFAGDPGYASSSGFPGDPVFPYGPRFTGVPDLSWELLLSQDPMCPGGSELSGGVASAEPSASSHYQAGTDSPQDAEKPVPAAPAPGPAAPAAVPVSPEAFNAGDFLPDLDPLDLLSL